MNTHFHRAPNGGAGENAAKAIRGGYNAFSVG